MNASYEELVLLNIMREGKLLPLQFAVKEKLEKNHFAFVFDEVGCGKTIEAGICIWDAICKGEKNILIIAPANLSFNWYAEMLSKFGVDFKIIGGRKDSVDLYYDQINCENLSNLCIVSYNSRSSENSNAAIDRIGKKNINWDLIILDEGHESKNENSLRYIALSNYRSNKLLFLSATPIKNLQDDFVNEFQLVRKIVNQPELQLNLDPIKAISFDFEYPISRNFKETISETKEFKKRNVYEITYKIADEIVKKLPYDGLSFDQKRNCIMLFENYLRKEYNEEFSIFRKSKYGKNDLEKLKNFDAKLKALIEKLLEIVDDNRERVVIFCNHIEVINYLKKILEAQFGSDQIEAIHGESYEQEERKRRIFLLDKENSDMNQKKIVILSQNIGSVGVNLSKFTHLINYELPYTPADLEQRFGRIDRLTNTAEVLNMYFFKDENQFFDTIYLNRIFMKLNWEVLPLLPGKNLLNTISKSLINNYEKLFHRLFRIEDYLKAMKGKKEIELNEIESKKELISVIKDLFDKVVIKSEKNEPVVSNITYILETIDKIKKQFGLANMENIKEKIEKYLEEQANKIFYVSNGIAKSLEFSELKDKVFTEEYLKYDKELQEKCQDIKDLSKIVIECYKTNSIDLMKNIRELYKEKDNQMFIVIYGIFCALKSEKCDIDFFKLMKEYNGGI